MGLNRRNFLKSGGFLAGAGLAAPVSTQMAWANDGDNNTALAELRGSFSATSSGLTANAISDQSKLLQTMLDEAAKDDKPVFLPSGNYFVSNIKLPKRTRLIGIPGASRLVFSGNGHFIMGEDASHIELQGVVFDGTNRGIASYAEAAVRITNCDHLVIDNCEVVGSLETGLHIDRSAGRIERTQVRGAGGSCGIYLMESRGMLVSNNVVSDCANGGILVHRWKAGEDGTMVTNNRVYRIGAQNGGTGQWGNGINVFRADSVIVTNNQIHDCAFSAIRSNAGDNIQISSNTCHRSGETAIYSEFEFNGALISSNVIDGGTRGISIANFLQGGRMAVCSNNLIRNIHTQPPYVDNDHLWGEGISVEADTTVTGNVIDNAEKFGFMLGWGPYLRNVVVSSNVIRGSERGAYISVVEGVGKVHVTDNVFSGATKGNIVGFRWKEPVTGDMALDGSPIDNLTLERNQIG